MKIIEPTWPGNRRSFWRRAQWGVLAGSAEVFAGTVYVLTLGQFASRLPMEVMFRLTVQEHRRSMEKSEVAA